MSTVYRLILVLFILSSFSVNSSQKVSVDSESLQPSYTKDSLWAHSSKGRELFEVVTDSGESITVVDVDGVAYSGDMILGYTSDLKQHGLKIVTGEEFPEDDGVSSLGAIRYPSSGYKWPNGVVPYVFASNLTSQARQDMQYAFNHWHQNTNVRFVSRTNQQDYIYIQNGGGCSSWIGKQGGRQIVNLARGCGRGAAVHELGHAVGFFHEQTRTDRDNYVTIYWNNIQSDMRYNFEKFSTRQGQNHGTYDYRSIMHYRTTAFGINGATTIWPKQDGVDTRYMGNGTKLSNGDIAAAAAIYGGSGPGPDPDPDGSVSLSKSTYEDTENIEVRFSGASGDQYDWIGLYREGTPVTEYLDWQYLNGATRGARQFSSLPAGRYEARLFFNDSYTVEASARFTVISANQTDPVVTTDKTTFSTRENILVRFDNASGDEYDWIGLYRRGASNSEYITWVYLRQQKRGSATFNALPAGNYSARLFFNDSYRLEAETDFRVVD
ncbi:M12 family metallopeptidase [Pleionea sediminis]|uniref:M12 family metallopeptidase n=1 Tax=Pleionea sediminis TaxID=2569479 RepID=UPI001184B5FB|nr:M12 family metallopeptidase [Pleionea sediminis]